MSWAWEDEEADRWRTGGGVGLEVPEWAQACCVCRTDAWLMQPDCEQPSWEEETEASQPEKNWHLISADRKPLRLSFDKGGLILRNNSEKRCAGGNIGEGVAHVGPSSSVQHET